MRKSGSRAGRGLYSSGEPTALVSFQSPIKTKKGSGPDDRKREVIQQHEVRHGVTSGKTLLVATSATGFTVDRWRATSMIPGGPMGLGPGHRWLCSNLASRLEVTTTRVESEESRKEALRCSCGFPMNKPRARPAASKFRWSCDPGPAGDPRYCPR